MKRLNALIYIEIILTEKWFYENFLIKFVIKKLEKSKKKIKILQHTPNFRVKTCKYQ